ncbi:RagB/SusD family nutrient uptake outer membrane protein [Mangrovibacterium lignilyticum]|uniref:RagB/SusD family nutrient uptake outer membrane protein n=1 Tax=Mangrovibacterium lignilyticum TaxID=2668052 RepID=UPI0013D612C0|nr:RagB/SusD family nutrient uptake outer membrane protein [Mangrovibacterium lignilyticum]
MKKLIYFIVIGTLFLAASSCQDNFIELTPPAQFTDEVYFKVSSDFKAYTASFYGGLPGWDFGTMDNSSDLTANGNGAGFDLGHGTISLGGTSWSYSGIRSYNILLDKAKEYPGNEVDIAQYVGEAYFFRAFAYFNLLKTFGGVPVVTSILDIDSPELYAPRNSRYEVVDQIISDLDAAIGKLPTEQAIGSDDKGRISKWAAEAFKAQVLLYEATWEKYVGQGPDGDGTTAGAGKAGYDAADVDQYLSEVVTLTEDVMTNGGYELWNKNDDPLMDNASHWYLFNLEDAGSNPGGYDKTTNKEYILYQVYDYTYKQSGKNLTWTGYQLYPSRKFVDMAVCKDGLPPEKSSQFQGYHTRGDEFMNRDLRLINYVYGSEEPSTTLTLDYGSLGFSGYGNMKYAVYLPGPEPNGRRTDGTESYDYPIIRLAEVYLMYAEALVELNGGITDEQLNASINKLRDRAAVAHLTNELVNVNGLDLLTEVRRERAVELYKEGKRFDDLKRWGILEESLNASHCGMVVGDASYSTEFKDEQGNATANYLPNSYVWGEETVETPSGELKCVVVDSYQNITVSSKHYLYPIPLSQMILNEDLLQNPGY